MVENPVGRVAKISIFAKIPGGGGGGESRLFGQNLEGY